MSAPHEPGMGWGGHCVCVRCGTRVPHRQGVPCREERCPSCGRVMLREGSEHHQTWLKKQRDKASQSD